MSVKGQCGCCGSAFAATPLVGLRCGYIRKTDKNLFVSLIEHYQSKIDPAMKSKLHVKRVCKYQPSCSEYTKQAIKKHGSFKGILLGMFRIARCNPFSSGGYDPVR